MIMRFYVLITLSIMFTITFLGNGIICGLTITNDTISKNLCYNMTEISVSILSLFVVNNPIFHDYNLICIEKNY